MEAKRAEVFARLESKQAGRLADRAKRRDGAVGDRDPTQSAQAFWGTFTIDVDRLKAEFEKLRASFASSPAREEDRPAVESQLDKWHMDVAAITQQIADATLFLPAFDVRQANGVLAGLTLAIDCLRTEVLPRKKFCFTHRELLTKARGPAAAPVPSTADIAPALPPSSEGGPEEYSIVGLAGQRVVISPGQLREGQDLRLENLTDCTLIIMDVVRAIRGSNLQRCTVYTGPVDGSVLLYTAAHCTFCFAARQIRIHDATSCDFYLCVKSQPIIENCSAVRFAPYALTYPEHARQMERADLSSAASLEMWKAVNDFNWHKVQQSPHWSVLPAAEAAPAVCLTAGGEVVSAAPRPPPLPPSAPLAAPLPPAPQGGDDDEL